MGSIITYSKKLTWIFLSAQKSNPLKISTNAYSTREKMVALNPLMRFAQKICGIWNTPLCSGYTLLIYDFDLNYLLLINYLNFVAHSTGNIPHGGDVTYSTFTFHSKCPIPLCIFHHGGIGTFHFKMSGMWSGIGCDLL